MLGVEGREGLSDTMLDSKSPTSTVTEATMDNGNTARRRYVDHVAFDKHEIVIFLHDGSCVSSSEYNSGFRWYIGHGADRMLVTRDAMIDIFRQNTFIEGIEALWHEAYKNAECELELLIEKNRIHFEYLDKAEHRKTCSLINKIIKKSDGGSATEIPDVVKDVPGIKRLDISTKYAIVYFLIHNKQVVYVGQTKSEWPSRIRKHLKDGKVFDDVCFITVPIDEIDSQENYYILKFSPKYNKIRPS
jgi:hypothetical protein